MRDLWIMIHGFMIHRISSTGVINPVVLIREITLALSVPGFLNERSYINFFLKKFI